MCSWYVRIALIVCCGAVSRTVYAEDNPGRHVFETQQCAECHKVSTQGIKSDGDAPDLAGVGNRHPADWMKRFLTKQETLDGKKHKKKFGGTDPELDQLVQWLASLK